MRAYRAALALLAVGLLGCGPKARPHVAPEQVEVIMPDEEVTEPYEVLGEVRKQAPLSTPESTLVMVARAEAGSLGAHALLIRTLDTYVESRPDRRERGTRVRRLLGQAIYFPGRR